jgi:hypothetical protein
MVTGGQDPLVVAGVAGGVGTSTWIRILQLGYPDAPVHDLSTIVYDVSSPLGRIDAWTKTRHWVDVLVTSNTAAAAAQIRPALALCTRPPLLVVMHLAAIEPADTRAVLRAITPNITARFDIAYRRDWLELKAAPGSDLPPKAKDIGTALAGFPHALQRMLAAPIRPIHTPPLAAPRPAAAAPLRHSPLVPRAGPRPPSWPPPPGGPAQVIRRGGQGG